MKKITQHLYLGNNVDMYNVLFGFGDKHITAVLDCTSDLPTSKWKKNNDIVLKKVGIKPDMVLTKTHIKRAVDYIVEQHKNGHAVLIGCKNDYSRSFLIMISYLVLHKGMTIQEAFDKIDIKNVPDSWNESNRKVIEKNAPQSSLAVKVEQGVDVGNISVVTVN